MEYIGTEKKKVCLIYLSLIKRTGALTCCFATSYAISIVIIYKMKLYAISPGIVYEGDWVHGVREGKFLTSINTNIE